jgi:predicted ferric reductase
MISSQLGENLMLRRQIFYISLYVSAILIPMLATLLQPVSDHPFLYEVGINFALISIMIFALQVLLVGRFKCITNTFGLDTLIRFHRYMAMFATCLVIAHPFLLASSSQNWSLLIGLDVPWYISFGRAALILLIANIIMSLYQSQFKIKFETWRIFHNIFGVSILGLAFIHSWFAGTSIQEIYFLKGLWVFLLIGSLSLFVYHRFLRPRILSRHPYQVAEVKREAKDVWTIKLIPAQGFPILSYLPGQFHFVTFQRQGLPEEEHHWTLSSSPTEQGFISSTIKELGDFTAKISQIRPGDTATIHGAFGRFSYLFYPKEKDFVFIAGGIGITPIISMLKSMRDTKMAFPVLLFYANKNKEDILFYEDLEKMRQEGYPQLEVVHILSEPSADWKEEKGHLDQEKIEKFCGDSLKDKAFYICGPQGLIDSIYKTLIQKNIKTNKIHTEIFSFLD